MVSRAGTDNFREVEEETIMAQLDPDTVGAIVGPIVGVPGLVVVVYLIIRYKLKNKELEMRARELELQGSSAELGAELDALRDDLEDNRAQLAEMQERIEFTERLLASGRESQEDRSR